MNAKELFTAAPGTRFLLLCEENRQERMVEEILRMMPESVRERTKLNTCSYSAMDICSDEEPNRFGDLLRLCSKLITVAGRRSHFEGILMLNIAGLMGHPGGIFRLKALGEFLALEGGLASRCTTVLYGPGKENELIQCADLLDFDGKLRVGSFDRLCVVPTVRELLRRSGLRCESAAAEKSLQSVLDRMASNEDFDAVKFIRTCCGEGDCITESSVADVLNDPYSYVNRLEKKATMRSEKKPERKIGFRTDAGQDAVRREADVR